MIIFRVCLRLMFDFYLEVLDSNIWTHEHQAVKACKKKNKVLPSAHYMRNVTCLHIVSHLHHQRFQLF